jgi:hypothetical protein
MVHDDGCASFTLRFEPISLRPVLLAPRAFEHALDSGVLPTRRGSSNGGLRLRFVPAWPAAIEPSRLMILDNRVPIVPLAPGPVLAGSTYAALRAYHWAGKQSHRA